jgi:hypothetical protein
VVSDSLNTVYKKKSEIVSRQIAGETMLIPVMGKIADMQKIFAMNAVGEFIWMRLDGKEDLGKISEAISSSFDVSQQQALAEAEEFVRELLQEDLIEAIN